VNRLDLKSTRVCNAGENAVFVALTLASRLSGEQARTGNGLKDLYGGGYEIITLFNNELRKVEKIGYHLYEAKPIIGARMGSRQYGFLRKRTLLKFQKNCGSK